MDADEVGAPPASNGIESRAMNPYATITPSMKTWFSVCARREACEMAAHPHPSPRAADRRSAPDRASTGTKLLIALQWALTLFGFFCLIGVAVVIAKTPDAGRCERDRLNLDSCMRFIDKC
jgi:hypothetical protein